MESCVEMVMEILIRISWDEKAEMENPMAVKPQTIWKNIMEI